MSAPDDVGDDVLDLGCVEGSIRESRGSFCLAGKLCTDRAYNTYALMDVMIKAFIKRRTKAAVCEWGHKLLIFTFLDESDRDRVIRNQPWHFDGHLFIVKSLNGSEQPSGVSITRASFWTRVYDLPIMCHTQATLCWDFCPLEYNETERNYTETKYFWKRNYSKNKNEINRVERSSLPASFIHPG
ncbi:hypothetical protein ACS0TY_000996 [Phlomoides rotata]